MEPQEVQGVLLEIQRESSEEKIVNFCNFYLQILEEFQPEISPANARATITLNPKLAQKEQLGWHQNEDLQNTLYKLVYSAEYNEARDIVRYRLESCLAEEIGWAGIFHFGWWDHLELFPDREIFPRINGESSKDARERHLRTRTIPYLELFLRCAATNSQQEFEEIIGDVGSPDILRKLEALFSSLKEEDVKRAKLATKYFLRREKIRWLRGMRWGYLLRV